MITKISIDGFKSLGKFDLQFKRGLNVLIGPNGAGKTNICQSLGLLASAADGTISEYILSLGGISKVFTANCSENATLVTKKITASCVGETIYEEENKEKVVLRYKYLFSILLEDELRIIEEKFQLYKKSDNGRFRIIMDTKRKPNSTEIIIDTKDKNEIGPINEQLLLKGKQTNFPLLHRDPLHSFLSFLGYISFYCYIALEDMKFSMAWNIDPHLAKKSSDILEPSRMLPDGRRLSNAIHSLMQSQDDEISEINAFLSRILPGYKKIESKTSSDSQRTFQMVDSRDIPCPAQSLSDGTVKVIALLVGVFSQQHSTSIIEEPENYLHPWACQLLIEFFRDYFSDGVCILTTHSETILNSIKPAEIIVIENINGFTNSRRLNQERQLVEAISMSGFGCGYHYLAGSLGGTPE